MVHITPVMRAGQLRRRNAELDKPGAAAEGEGGGCYAECEAEAVVCTGMVEGGASLSMERIRRRRGERACDSDGASGDGGRRTQDRAVLREREAFAREGVDSWSDLWRCAGRLFDERKVLEGVATTGAACNVAPSKPEKALAP